MSSSAKTRRIGKYHFRLSGKQTLYFKGKHVACFTPLPKKKLLTSRSITPTFNHDRKHYTYAFHLPSCPHTNESLMLEEHQKRANQALLELSTLWMPKPRSRHKYCGVCRGHYEDYKDHIESELHNLHLKNSKYQDLIVKLSSQFQLEREEEPNVIDLTTEEAVIKVPSELTDTTSSLNQVPHLAT